MSKQTGTIITIILAVVFGCCGLAACLIGGGILLGFGTYTTTGVIGETAGQIPPAYGVIGLCLTIIFIAVPVVSYFLFVRGKNDQPPPAMPPAV